LEITHVYNRSKLARCFNSSSTSPAAAPKQMKKLPARVRIKKPQNVSNANNNYAKKKLELQQLASSLQLQDEISLDL
jgi:hypothetical protein